MSCRSCKTEAHQHVTIQRFQYTPLSIIDGRAEYFWIRTNTLFLLPRRREWNPSEISSALWQAQAQTKRPDVRSTRRLLRQRARCWRTPYCTGHPLLERTRGGLVGTSVAHMRRFFLSLRLLMMSNPVEPCRHFRFLFAFGTPSSGVKIGTCNCCASALALAVPQPASQTATRDKVAEGSPSAHADEGTGRTELPGRSGVCLPTLHGFHTPVSLPGCFVR